MQPSSQFRGTLRGAATTRCSILALALIPLLSATGAWAAAPELGEARNFDARIGAEKSFAASAADAQLAAVVSLQAELPTLSVSYDPLTGVTSSLYNRAGHLTGPSAGDILDAALDFARANHQLLGLTAADLDDVEVTDRVYSRVSGVTHLYLRQRHEGLAVWGGRMHAHFDPDGRLISLSNGFVPDIATASGQAVMALSAQDAVVRAARDLGIAVTGAPQIGLQRSGAQQITHLSHAEISSEEIEAQLMWLPTGAGQVSLVWNFFLHTPDGNHIYDLTVDAASGKTWTRIDSVASDSYRVFEEPLMNPAEGGRTVVTNPADGTASPSGWFDSGTTIMNGNNVHAYQDRDANNQPPASQPSCGAALNCDFGLNLNTDPVNGTNPDAAVANLFYWNNLVHDVQYQYGFDEVGGNFQDNNFGRGGASGDSVRAEAQDGAGTNNANFSTPSDGNRPRMQMFLWNNTNPRRDGDFDNGIIAHEYGHGISIRQVGGPGGNCLGGSQQPGEGWSDLMSVIYTAKTGDQAGDPKGVGGWAANNNGIRPSPYSTNFAINDFVFQDIRSGLSVPHGVGFVFATAVWEAYWELVGAHGFSPNLANAFGGFGNQRAMLYINEGLKFTNCAGNTVNFLNARDGILQAAGQFFGGEDVCRLWEGFARRGLGANATSGNSLGSATNGFNLPPECDDPPPVTSCLFTANFSSGSDNFVFVDDPQDPLYTSGVAASGAVSVTVGGVDDADILNMLGSWNRTCTLAASTAVTIAVNADMTQASEYESNEFSELQLTVNGSTTTLATLTGDGNGGAAQTVGPQTFNVNVTLPAGTSTISLGCFNNQKTFNNESTTCDFNSVSVTGGGGNPPVLDADFDVDTDGFGFQDDPQDPAYSDGQRDANGGVGGSGGLEVTLGGIDNADILNMDGSWTTSFSGSGSLTLTLDANITQASDYESNEFSEVAVVVDGNRTVLATITGDGNGGVAQTTGFQSYTVNLSLGSGSHTLELNCFNNQKTFNNESTTCVFDNVLIQ